MMIGVKVRIRLTPMNTQTSQMTELATSGNISVVLYSVNKNKW